MYHSEIQFLSPRTIRRPSAIKLLQEQSRRRRKPKGALQKVKCPHRQERKWSSRVNMKWWAPSFERYLLQMLNQYKMMKIIITKPKRIHIDNKIWWQRVNRNWGHHTMYRCSPDSCLWGSAAGYRVTKATTTWEKGWREWDHSHQLQEE